MGEEWVGRGMGWERDGLEEGWIGKRITGDALIILPFKIVVKSLYIHLHRTPYCKLRFLSSTGLTFKLLVKVVQYTYRLYEANRDNPPNESAPSRENLVIGNCTLHTVV